MRINVFMRNGMKRNQADYLAANKYFSQGYDNMISETQVALGDRMANLLKQQSKVLAEKNGWSLDFAEGFLKGEYARRSGIKLSTYATVGLTEYCLGFRAGYFVRRNPATTRVERMSSAS